MFDVAKIKERVPIEAYLEARDVEIFPSGDGLYRAKCPLPDHNDRTPSFTVYAKDQRYYCFGCNRSGDLIDLVMAIEDVDFQEACRRLGGIQCKGEGTRRKASSKTRPDEDAVRQLEEAASSMRDEILRTWRWPIEQIQCESNVEPREMKKRGWKLLLRTIFDPEDVVWIGGHFDSGSPCHRQNFRLRNEWLAEAALPGAHTCPATFKPGSWARTSANIVRQVCLVIESDTILGRKPTTEEEKTENRLGCAALIHWMREELGMSLVAVVDTANKSLHGYFRMPSPNMLHELKAIAAGLRLDEGLFRASHPVRLPGAIHEESGKKAKLIFLQRTKTDE